MKIVSFQKFTLVDYPGKIATTVFTPGCSFRCPFCYNPELVIGESVKRCDSVTDSFFEYLDLRKGKIEGVCITGGEPTLQPGLIDFMKRVKDLGYFVKLDSNGSHPEILKKVIDAKIVDFIAMDIKNSLDRYEETVGIRVDLNKIKESVDIIKNSGIDYDFRTTVVPGVHTYQDFENIKNWIGGAKRYSLQGYKEMNILDESLKEKSKGKYLDLDKIKKNIEGKFGEVIVRE